MRIPISNTPQCFDIFGAARDWGAQLCTTAFATEPAMPEYPWCLLLACYRAWDKGEDEAAATHIENALAASKTSGRLFQHYLFLEAASVSASFRKRAPQARTWLERACKLRRPESVDAAEAAIAVCEERFADALAHLEAAKAYVKRRKLDSGIVRFANEKWAEQEELCRAALNRAA